MSDLVERVRRRLLGYPLPFHCANCGAAEEDWQDADRTMTPVELSKIGPGWEDF